MSLAKKRIFWALTPTRVRNSEAHGPSICILTNPVGDSDASLRNSYTEIVFNLDNLKTETLTH